MTTCKSIIYPRLNRYLRLSPFLLSFVSNLWRYFRHTPEPFYHLAKELYPGNFKPTHAHYFIRLLHEKGLLLRNYSQNIDTLGKWRVERRTDTEEYLRLTQFLEKQAGIPAEKVIEAHGSFSCAHCLECKKEYSPDSIREVWQISD